MTQAQSTICIGRGCGWASHCARTQALPSQNVHILVPAIEKTAERCDLYQKHFTPWGEGRDHA